MILPSSPGKKLITLFIFLFPLSMLGQEIRGLRIYVDVSAQTYLKFQKPIDGIEGNFRDKGYNFKNRSGGNALNITPPTDRALEPAEIEVSEGGRNHLFLITPYPKKYDPNIDPPFDYIIDNSDKLKKFVQQAEQDRSGGSPANTKPAPVTPAEAVETPVVKTVSEPVKNIPAGPPPPKKAADDGYNANIGAADKAFNDKNYFQAKVAYTEAYRIRINEKYPLSRLQLIAKLEEDAEAKVKEEEEKQKAVDLSYTTELQKADRYLLNGEYSLARESYSKASLVKPQETYPKTKISEVDVLVKDILAKQDADKLQKAVEAKQAAADQEVAYRYKTAISKADKAFAGRQFDVARLAYSDALKIKPGEKYPDDKLNEIAEIQNSTEAAAAEKIIKDRSNELTIKYNNLVAKGDKAVKDKQFDVAKTAYDDAIAIKPSENIAQTQLAALNDEIEVAKAAEAERLLGLKQKEIVDKYNTAISKADKAFAAKNYETAKTEYYNAQTLKPGETYPQAQLSIIDTRLSEANAAIAKQKEVADGFKKAVAAADIAFSAKNYDLAKSSYNSALEIKPDDAYAKGKIIAIEKLEEDLAIQASQAALKALNERCDAAIAEGDKAYGQGDYAIAMVAYENALDLIPNKSYPASQIKVIKRKQYEQAELEKTEKYNGLVSLGDKAFSAKSYESAKGYFNQALEVKPDETYPKQQIAIINDPGEIERIGKREELKQYNLYVDDGDKAFKAGNFDEARTNYKKALGIKPDVPYLVYKLNQVDDAVAALSAAEKSRKEKEAQQARDDKYNGLVVRAAKAFDSNDFDGAKSLYKEALDVKPGDAGVNDKIATIDKKVAQLAADAEAAREAKQKEVELNKQFTSLVAKADKAYDSKQFEAAKTSYESAVLLKPDDKYSRNRLEQIEKDLAALTETARSSEAGKTNAADADNNYNSAISRASKAMDAKLYYEAKAAYNDALAIKPNETLPVAKLSEIEKALATENALKDGAANPAVADKTTNNAAKSNSKSEKAASTTGTGKMTYQKQALPYTQAELFKRYNTINFYDPPPGQKLIPDAFFAADTLANFNNCEAAIAEAPRLDISDSANNVKLTLQGINFEGSSVYIKMRIQNFGKQEFLTGRMLFTWYRKDGSKVDYYASYITAYPYLLPGKEINVVYATRSSNASEGETFGFVMDDRLKTTRLELKIPSETYIKEYDR